MIYNKKKRTERQNRIHNIIFLFDFNPKDTPKTQTFKNDKRNPQINFYFSFFFI